VFALPVAAAFGFTFTTLVEGRAETRLPWRPDLSHSPGAFQANPIAALADFTGVAAGVTLLLHVGDRAVHLIPLGPGHTDTDLVVNVPDAHAWLVGDVVEASGPPMYGSGCFPLGLPLQLAFLLNEVTDADVVVPSHGPVVDRTFIEAQHAEVERLAQQIRSAKRRGQTVEQALADQDNWPFPVRGLQLAVQRGYTALDADAPPGT